MPADLRSVPDPGPPKLVEQLKLLRDEWGEGFDEDIATPLAAFVLTMREQHKALHRSFDEGLEEVEGQRDFLSERVDELEERLSAEEVLDDLGDMRRGVRSVQELYDKWLVSAPA